MNFDINVVWEAIPALLQGAKLTIFITATGLFGGILLGAMAGTARAFGNRWINGIAFTYIEIIRGTPIVVQVMFIYFALPLAAGIRVDAMTAAVGAIAINSGAYIAEIVRGSLLSIDKGMIEAGKALGVSKKHIFMDISAPLAFRRMIPSLGNQCIVSLKDTSLFIVIGVAELTRQGQEIMASNFRALEIWSAVAVIYLIITCSMALTLRIIEKRMKVL